jgi:hypothetical protein
MGGEYISKANIRKATMQKLALYVLLEHLRTEFKIHYPNFCLFYHCNFSAIWKLKVIILQFLFLAVVLTDILSSIHFNTAELLRDVSNHHFTEYANLVVYSSVVDSTVSTET